MQEKNDSRYYELIQQNRFAEAKTIHRVFALFTIVYLSFCIADYMYVPDRFLEFFSLRLLYCLIPISLYFYANKMKNFRETEWFAAIHATVAAGIITYMIFTTSGVKSPYYAGLNLVGIIALCFFTFSWRFYFLTVVLIYAPYFVLFFKQEKVEGFYQYLVLNSFFVTGTIMVCSLIHHFRETYRSTSVKAQQQLQNELQNRNEIILKKTSEAVALANLSSQFSPQIVESIRTGKINIDQGGQRAEICAVFIDIVNSTERVTRIDKDKVEKVLSRFLDDSIKILLKYDITIDKFLGDGILAFCNAPLKRIDYISRTINAAIEIKDKINSQQEFFERNWQKHLEIRVGIAKGFANVGFYGSQKYYRSYTAIGPVINLASRLCSSAQPGQILIDYDVFDLIKDDFETTYLDKRTLKGFEEDVIHTYEVTGNKKFSYLSGNVNECPHCGSILALETNESGNFVFLCKSCCSVIDNLDSNQVKKVS